MTSDVIELRGLQVQARCGVLDFERTQDQPLQIDLDLTLDLSVAGASDELGDTVDYGAVCALVERVCAASAPQLLERLATSIADEILASTAADGVPVAEVTVAVRKLRPPVPQLLATSGVRITRAATAPDPTTDAEA